tara:strand:+ start:109 stop:534 length:426 start_codon:yes stop_codon:yes gene_type:complete
MPRKIRPTKRAVGTKYRSNFEVDFASDLIKRGLKFDYEPDHYTYIPNPTTYTPDFYIPQYNFYVETKGFFTSEDRTKHLTFRDQHPNIDVRFVFSNSKNKLRKGAKTTYGAWCERNGFLYSDRVIDETWLAEETEEDAKED